MQAGPDNKNKSKINNNFLNFYSNVSLYSFIEVIWK